MTCVAPPGCQNERAASDCSGRQARNLLLGVGSNPTAAGSPRLPCAVSEALDEPVIAPEIHPHIAPPQGDDPDRLRVADRLEVAHVDDAAIPVPRDGTIGPHRVRLVLVGALCSIRQSASPSAEIARSGRGTDEAGRRFQGSEKNPLWHRPGGRRCFTRVPGRTRTILADDRSGGGSWRPDETEARRPMDDPRRLGGGGVKAIFGA